MKRDLELVREICFELEKKPYDPLNPSGLEIEGFTSEKMKYHIKIMEEAGLIDCAHHGATGNKTLFPIALTWAGCEFIDAARDNDLWKKSQKLVAGTLSSAAFELIKIQLLELGKKALGIA